MVPRGSRGYKLSLMTSHRVLFCIVVALTACRSGDRSTVTDSAAVDTTLVAPVPPVVLNPGWNDTVAGPALLLPVADSTSRASVVLPYLTDSVLAATTTFALDSLAGMQIDLFGSAGVIGSSALGAMSGKRQAEGCLLWPEVSLATIPSREWKVGLRKGAASGLKLDSVETMSAGDSSRITAEIARLASALTDGADSSFQGLPFTVRKAYRFSLDGMSILASDVVRRIAAEANPREEHTLLIAERPAGGEAGYTAGYHSRVSGSENVVRTHEILAAMRFIRNGRAAVVVAFGYEDGGRVALLERTGERSWRVSWRSAYSGC